MEPHRREMDRMDRVTARAPAKVNICFRVGALQDDGSHSVATLYQAVSLYDRVTATASDSFELVAAGGTERDDIHVGERNLAVRAAKLLAEHAGYRGGAALAVEKNIPRRAGMSGGSADAAAALVACNELWATGLDRGALQELALELGADVPFALEGGTAVGTGHGDEFSQALSTGKFHWVIVPGLSALREDEVVAALDAHRDEHRDTFRNVPTTPVVDTAVLQAVRSGCAESLADVLLNDLQMATLRLASETAETLEIGETHGALAGITLTTTSAAAFLMEHHAAALALARVFESHGRHAIIAHGPVGGARLV